MFQAYDSSRHAEKEIELDNRYPSMCLAYKYYQASGEAFLLSREP